MGEAGGTAEAAAAALVARGSPARLGGSPLLGAEAGEGGDDLQIAERIAATINSSMHHGGGAMLPPGHRVADARGCLSRRARIVAQLWHGERGHGQPRAGT